MVRLVWSRVALAGVLGLASALAQAEAPARSLIVQLKPSAREGSLVSTSAQLARQERLSSLARAAGYPASMAWRPLNDRILSLKVPTTLRGEARQKVMARLVATGQVEWVEAGVRERLLAATVQPNDTYYTEGPYDERQWWLKEAADGGDKATRQRGASNINLAWTTSRGLNQPSSGVVVAVLDTGHVAHPDIDPARIEPGYDFVSDTAFSNDGDEDSGPDGRDPDPSDPGDWVTAEEAQRTEFRQLGCVEEKSSWHGLVITGMLAARTNNGQGVAGMNWGARVLPVRVAGKCGADVEDIIDGIRWSAGLAVGAMPQLPSPRARIINISFGGDGACGLAYQAAINEARARGVVVVAAAGNEHGRVSRPGNCSGVIAVAALNREGYKASYSNFGPEVTVGAVGGDPGPQDGMQDDGEWGTYLGDKGLLTVVNTGATSPASTTTENNNSGSWYAYHAGTSFSAPIVSGVISLMLDVNPTLTADQIESGIRASARPHVLSSLMGQCSTSNPGRCICTTDTCGAGIVDAAEALRYAANPDGYVNTATAENIDTDSVQQALSAASQDRQVSSGGTSDGGSDGGGGGGSMDLPTVLGALMVLAALWLTPRRALPRPAVNRGRR